MKIATRSLIMDPNSDMAAAIGQSFIDAYIQAAREMHMPHLVHVERRQMNHDLQFVLTFESIQIVRVERTDDAIRYVFGVPT